MTGAIVLGIALAVVWVLIAAGIAWFIERVAGAFSRIDEDDR